jgi:subtilisin family serine protease
MGRKSVILVLVAIIFLAVCAWAENNLDQPKPYTCGKPFAQGEVIIKFKKAADINSIFPGNSGHVKVKKMFKKNHDNRSVGSAANDNAGDKIDGPGMYKIKFEDRDDIYSIIDDLKNNPDVEYAEPNYIFQSFIVPNDPHYSLEWGASKIGATSAWDVTKGASDVVIAVVDTGVDYNHPDLAPNIWINTKEIPGNGIDDDGNGYVDDVRGWDFVTVPPAWVAPGEDPGPPDNDPMDFLGHGTHVAGIASGLPNNGLGIAGIGWNCKIMALRAGYQSGDDSGYLELDDIAEAVYYAADNGADIINMSFGCPYNSITIQNAINYAYSKGCIMVASAGNVDSYDAGKPFYPAANDHVIAVSALDDKDIVAIWSLFCFSNFGDFVDICAPGTSIISTLPGGSYGYASGTSMSAPFVSGVAALIKSKNKDWTSQQVEERLKRTSDNVYAVNGQSFFKGKLGAGRVSAKKALGNLSMVITYPTPDKTISGSVAVKGSANMEYFKDYKLEYSDSSIPNSWSPIVAASTTPIEDGTLAIWCVTNPNGVFNLRLTVSNTSGESYQYVSGVNFGLDGEVKLNNPPVSGPSPFDPDRQKFMFYYELLAASDVDIYVYDISGTLIWREYLPYNGGTSGGGGSAGINRVYWDGTNSFGETLGNGAYLYMIIARTNGDRKIIGRGKFAVLRG